jgi:hypothetical protein
MLVTFKNQKVELFFSGTSDEAPLDEIKYIVEKRPVFSFLNEIGSEIELATIKAQRKNIKLQASGVLHQRFSVFLLLLSDGIQSKDDTKIAEALKNLREIRLIAKSIIDM